VLARNVLTGNATARLEKSQKDDGLSESLHRLSGPDWIDSGGRATRRQARRHRRFHE